MADMINPEDLADGKVLLDLKDKFISEPTQENLFPLLCCLRDSVVSVPFVVEMSEEDKKRAVSTQEGETFTNKDEVKLTADILKAENGMKFFPVFSQEEQMPEEYKQRFTVIPITMMDCLKMAHGDSSVSGLVLDGFTTSFVLPFDLADYMAQIPSRLQKTDENE